MNPGVSPSPLFRPGSFPHAGPQERCGEALLRAPRPFPGRADGDASSSTTAAAPEAPSSPRRLFKMAAAGGWASRPSGGALRREASPAGGYPWRGKGAPRQHFPQLRRGRPPGRPTEPRLTLPAWRFFPPHENRLSEQPLLLSLPPFLPALARPSAIGGAGRLSDAGGLPIGCRKWRLQRSGRPPLRFPAPPGSLSPATGAVR